MWLWFVQCTWNISRLVEIHEHFKIQTHFLWGSSPFCLRGQNIIAPWKQSPGRIAVAMALASHGDFWVVLYLFLINLFVLAVLHIFNKMHAFGNGALVVGYTAIHTAAHVCRARWKLGGGVISRLTDRPRPVRSMRVPVPAEQQVLVMYAMWGADHMSHPFCSS